MQTRATLHPGQKGTRSLLERFGDRLVCVAIKCVERELRSRVKRAGAKWNPELGLVRQFGLTDRIVPKISKSRNPNPETQVKKPDEHPRLETPVTNRGLQ